jgi:hypothetical protein
MQLRPAYLKQVRVLIWKDLLVEARSRETIIAGAVFALVVLVIFNFAFDLRVEDVAAVSPGVLWVTVTFASVLSLGAHLPASATVARSKDCCSSLWIGRRCSLSRSART